MNIKIDTSTMDSPRAETATLLRHIATMIEEDEAPEINGIHAGDMPEDDHLAI